MEPEKRVLTDKPVAIILFVVGAIMTIMAFFLPETSLTERFANAHTIPVACGVLLMLFSAILFLQACKKDKQNKGRISSILEQLKEDKLVYLLFGLTIIYIFLFDRLGFVVSTILYTWGTSFLLGKGKVKIWAITVIALSISIGAYIFFAILLDVRMPSGILI